MSSNLFSLRAEDFAKGAALAVIVAVLGGAQQLFLVHGFDFGSYDWAMIVNLAITAGLGYLTKNFISDSNGAVLGRIGGSQ